MENANSERLLNLGRNHGREQAYRLSKHKRPRPNLSSSRDPAVRYRMSNLTEGISSLDKSELGLSEIVSTPLDFSKAGRILTKPELWELLLYIADENKKVHTKLDTRIDHPPPLPYNTDFSSTFGKPLRGELRNSRLCLNNDVSIEENSVASTNTSYTFDVRPPVSPRSEESSMSGLKKKKKRKRKKDLTTIGSTTSNVSYSDAGVMGGTKMSKILELNLGSWSSVNMGALRSLSLTLGDSLISVSLRNCLNLTNEMIACFGSRLYSLESLDLSGCILIGDEGCRSFSEFCGGTLTSVDLSGCGGLSHEACGWISGCLGHNRPGCYKLRSIDLSNCPNIIDRALTYLSHCRKLKYASFTSCTKLTSVGIISLSKGCKNLRVLNLSTCVNVGDDGIISLGMNCSNLLSLNCSMLNLLTDRALAGLSLGCTKLQAINVAGAKKISEAGLCEVARRCGNLGTLNVGGCELVTRNGLLALIEGLEYVEEAKTFFGFLPIDKSTDVKLKAQQEMIENSGAIRIQNAWHNMITRREAKKMVKFLRENKAALSIQLAFQRYLKRKAHWLIRWEHHRNLAMVEVQRVLRGYWGRKRSTALMLWWRELLSNAQYAVLLQAKARGHHVRKHDKLVAPALTVLHEKWEQERRSTGAVKIQAAVRRMLARFRTRGWREVYDQRMSDRAIAINLLQRTIRAFQSRCQRVRLLFLAEITRKLRDRAAVRMQNLYRIAQGKYGGLMRGEELARMKRIRNRAALHCQRVFRGFLGREEKRAAEFEHQAEMDAALLVQRVFRSTRILHWKDIKMNKVAAFVYKRQQLELQERQRCADIRNAQRLDGAQQDSASEEETHVDVNDLWQEMWDETLKKPYWHNPSLQTNTYEKPLVYAFERSVIGLKVKIYWPMNDESFTGKVTKYNKSKKRWRVNYKDGDHEWIDFEVEHERVQVYSDGSWKMFKLYQPPIVGVIRDKVTKRKDEEGEMLRLKRIAESWQKLGYDEEHEYYRYYSLLRDETRHNKQGEDFENWEIKQEKGSARWVYFNSVSEKSVEWDQPDPRLSPAEDTEIMKLFKIQLISDLRYGAYFCRALVDEYFASEEVNQKRKVLERLRKDTSSKKMAIALVNAAKVWEPKEYNEIEELVECTQLQRVISELLDTAEKTAWAMKDVRKGLLKMGEGQVVRICPKCHYEIENASATYCDICGFKLVASLAGMENMTEEEKEDHRRTLHRGERLSVDNRKQRATFRATKTFRSTKQGLDIDLNDLDLDDDDDEELGLTPSNSVESGKVEGDGEEKKGGEEDVEKRETTAVNFDV
ncbi:hypothetical protein TrLO_g9608 [Triparma laevis f. longispina]|uniref:WW domain-containing protein n=1 Tax=Triparma laevis f. longispina TaxID=1714387 RepID=A0A9W7C7X7_9STRA|nr:hypothetical protein TrLO_g9608 [Triparma laevis f. longispina]